MADAQSDTPKPHRPWAALTEGFVRLGWPLLLASVAAGGASAAFFARSYVSTAQAATLEHRVEQRMDAADAALKALDDERHTNINQKLDAMERRFDLQIDRLITVVNGRPDPGPPPPAKRETP